MLSSCTFKSLIIVFVISTLPIAPELLAQNPPGAAATSEVVSGNNQFALALYQNLTVDKTSKDQNIFLSPYSISTALAMTYIGSRSNTQKQMAAVLHIHMPDAQLEAGYSSLLAQTQATPAKHYKLDVANALWGEKDYHFEAAFTTALSKYFEGGFNAVDFVHNREASRLKINKWVEDKTAGKIKDLLHAGDIDNLTRLILTNAIYFKGDWASKFEKAATRSAPFLVHPDKIVNVAMMEQEGDFPFVEDGSLKMIELPYAGNDLSMIVMVPEKDVERLGGTLTVAKLHELRRRMSSPRVDVFLPRFKFETRYYLEKSLPALGMPDAFDVEKADFSGMTGHRDFCLSHVIHQAMIDVNEEGSEAAAATEVVLSLKSAALPPPVIFRADRPFIFMIVHKPTDSILFMGRVCDPPGSTPASPNTHLPPWTVSSGTPGPGVNPVVTLLPSGEYRPRQGPVEKGQSVPDYNVEGGLKPVNLAMPPVAGAPAGASVLLMIDIGPNGNVTSTRVLADVCGCGPQVEDAAMRWKFKPPTIKGQPVSTRTTVKVIF
jgi:serpin B